MKTGTPDHPKMLDLADWIDQATGGALRACGVDPEALAVGMMERLWQWAAKYCPAGDVGRFSSARIASAVGWRGDADALVAALIQIGWCDADADGNPIIHDWPEHCEDAVHARLARKREYFADGSRPRLTKLESSEKQEALRYYEGAGQPPAPVGNRRQPAAEVGARRLPDAPGGALPGPGPLPKPKPEPREGPPRAREAASTPPAPEAPLPENREGGVVNSSERSKPPEWAAPETWAEACRLADLIESAPTGAAVVGRGERERAGFVALLLDDAGKGNVLRTSAADCVWAIEQLAGGRWKDGSKLGEIIRALQTYPDGVYPAGSGTCGDKRASRLEEAIRLMRKADAFLSPDKRGRKPRQ